MKKHRQPERTSCHMSNGISFMPSSFPRFPRYFLGGGFPPCWAFVETFLFLPRGFCSAGGPSILGLSPTLKSFIGSSEPSCRLLFVKPVAAQIDRPEAMIRVEWDGAVDIGVAVAYMFDMGAASTGQRQLIGVVWQCCSWIYSHALLGSSPAGSPKPYYIMATRAASSSENRLGALVAVYTSHQNPRHPGMVTWSKKYLGVDKNT